MHGPWGTFQGMPVGVYVSTDVMARVWKRRCLVYVNSCIENRVGEFRIETACPAAYSSQIHACKHGSSRVRVEFHVDNLVPSPPDIPILN